MNRRLFLLAAPGALVSLRAAAHHGWSGFDETKPYYLAGEVVAVRWQNPHAELELSVADSLEIPAGLAGLVVPAQQASVDGAGLLRGAALPPRPGVWTVELAPLTRMNAWRAPEPKVGSQAAVVGFTRPGAPESRLRAEFLIDGDRVYPLRSAPIQ